MFRKVLIANRGAIACRIVRTLRKMGVGSVAVYAQPDRHSLHVRQADEAVAIESYLSVPALLEAARQTGAEAIHPGYGFLSENAEFAEACAAAGIVFLGPTPAQMRAFGLKHTARQIAAENGAPLLPGTELLGSVDEAIAAADTIGYPVMLKSTAGGGGIGMRLCGSAAELADSYAAVQRLSQASFGTGGLYLEKFVANARHIEVQIFGEQALGERDCSAQRRNQKVIEETPAPGIDNDELLATAVRLAKAVHYQSAGTVEFLYDQDTGRFYFLEVNTRLQVEHGVTEEVTGIDLVECMVRQALPELPKPHGHSIQVRIYAEDPARNFQPSAGQLSLVVWPKDARVETWVESGTEVTPYYDPMLAKIIVHDETRAGAVQKMRAALAQTRIYGIETNLEYLRQVCAHPAFEAGGISTSFLRDFPYRRNAIEVLDPGTQTTVQDYPGRLGYWHVGVPPSGPMDSLSFRLANRLVGNPEDAAGLEITVAGPTLRFTCDATVALTGAKLDAPHCEAFLVKSGETLTLGAIQGAGARAYLAVAGGIDVPEYLGSRSTFILGKFGRPLRTGDVIHIDPAPATPAKATAIPFSHEWQIAVLYGPHGAPDFFTPNDIETFFSAAWRVHHNSDRTGVRLIGPKPTWARRDGGEAGLHPSNIHDNAYAIGTVDFTGDMPVILGPDGPSLGGFVCPATIIDADLWRIGQLKPGDTVRFTAVSQSQALEMEARLDQALANLDGKWPSIPAAPLREDPILKSSPVIRADGDKYLLVEYGPNVLDLNLRFRVHALESGLRAEKLAGIVDITPGVRSLHIHYDSRRLSREALLEALDGVEQRIPDFDDIVVPSRIVHLPLSWDDPATQLAISKYTQSVRPDAPWAPSNIEFIRRINGLASIDDVHRIVFDANYLVLGLGDVYLGAPVATPVDPRHRLVTTKYNPARTWTPENAVGIGGAYLCVYGMEGPGGYQFVGRTLQMWNTYRADPPWLLRFFDQIRFYPVSAGELLEIRDNFPYGGYPLRIEPKDFRLRDYHAFLGSIEAGAARFKRTQQEAFLAERERWAASGLDTYREPPDMAMPAGSDGAVPEGCRAVPSPITASVWNIAVEAGQRVAAGDRLLVLEAMKMEIAVAAPFPGIVETLNCAPGALVFAGQNLVTVRQEGTGLMPNIALNLGALRELYRSREARPSDVVAEVYRRVAAGTLEPVWISLIPREVAIARARKLEADSLAAAKPLFGVPFAIKDNIDVAGAPTTAGCPAFAYSPGGNATVVQALVDAGAIPIGKTNLDQFATGLVGTRSPYGANSSIFNSRYISGGSSAGSALAVAGGMVSFSLGSDTAGSGRVPAAFNNLIGLKPTRGLLSTLGLVPACRTLDCVSIFAHTCHDAHTVLQTARGFDPLDPFSRAPTPGQDAAPWLTGRFRFGVPASGQLEFFGDGEAAALYQSSLAAMESLGGEKVEIDFAPFRAAADLLYSGPWVAERLAELREFMTAHAAEMDPTVRQIISGADRHTAVDTFKAMYRLAELRRASEAEWQRMDVLVLPTTGTIYTHEQVAADPVRLNTNLGYYTNFVNLLDLAALALPAGFRPNGLPFGISLIGPAFSDEALLAIGDRYHRATAKVPEPAVELERFPPGCIALAVVGAHLSGEQLNWQLTERGARRIKACRTAPPYRLYALDRTVPPKPGLVRDDTYQGAGIEVEVWAVPEDRFGSFVANVPPPLGIGSVLLDSGETVSCFICEPYAIAGATEITRFGGWRNYLSHAASIRV